jgi:hypothetical protein
MIDQEFKFQFSEKISEDPGLQISGPGDGEICLKSAISNFKWKERPHEVRALRAVARLAGSH